MFQILAIQIGGEAINRDYLNEQQINQINNTLLVK